jgi:hypothetical protein
MKKALAGPAKRTSKLPERRAMIAAARRRIGLVLSAAASWTRKVDRGAARRIERLRPRLVRWAGRLGKTASGLAKQLARRLRPALVLLLRGFSRGERGMRRVGAVASREGTRASAVLTPERAICGVIVASAICLVVSQFISYRSIEIGQPAYAGLTGASPPTVGVKTAGEAHSYLLIPIALFAAIAGTLALRPNRRGLGRVVVALGLLSIAVILLVDLPAGLDAGAQTSRFAGATAVLDSGFYAQLAAAGGLLYYARPCRIPINLSGRAASARRRRRRRRDSSPDRVARRPSPRRNGEASAPASQR